MKPDCELTKVKRQAAASKILLLATEIKNHKQILIPSETADDIPILAPEIAEKHSWKSLKTMKTAST